MAIFAFSKLIMSYLNRIADKILIERLEAFGAVLIEGPNGVENNHSGTDSKSVIKLQDPDMRRISCYSSIKTFLTITWGSAATA